ncbi:DUF4956 domain-containing protein [Nocardioides alcanivorans]|uniref:DUF4956 domain-containing protein n=1 Tax=Nocardioides alcanivorans TaxID=2897352 RepID=UPI001F19B21F|nr:DUF4956 domain-containing protein [Nocardioides alcanivorans]
MPSYSLYALDLVAICVLVFGLFLPRHKRPELIVAFLTVNVGVLAVASVLSSSAIGAGLGLGLFGVLSIIRLRSEELSHSDVAYYFASLAIGLLCGLGGTASWSHLALVGGVVAAVLVGDSPLLVRASSQQLLLDRAYVDRTALVAHLEKLLATTVLGVKVLRTDLVNDTTLVDVRHRSADTTRTPDTAPAREMIR